MAQVASAFWPVGAILDRFVARGCSLRTAEETIDTGDGDGFNVRYLLHPTDDRLFVPLVDLRDDDRVAEGEVAFWERRLRMQVGRPEQPRTP